MEPSKTEAARPELHQVVERKLVKIFGEDRARMLLNGLLTQLDLGVIETTNDLARVAEALEARSGFEGTTGAVLSVMVTMRRSQGL